MTPYVKKAIEAWIISIAVVRRSNKAWERALKNQSRWTKMFVILIFVWKKLEAVAHDAIRVQCIRVHHNTVRHSRASAVLRRSEKRASFFSSFSYNLDSPTWNLCKRVLGTIRMIIINFHSLCSVSK